MCFGIKLNILRPKVSVLDNGAGQNLFCMSFLPAKWRNHIRPIHNTSLMSVSNSFGNVIVKFKLFIQLSDLHMRVHFGVVDTLAVPLLIRTSFVDRFDKEIFFMEWRIAPIPSLPVSFISEYTALLDLLAVLHSNSDAETIIDYRQDNNTRTPLSRFAKWITTLPNTEASIPVTNSSSGPVFVAPKLKWMWDRTVRPRSGTINALLNVLTKISVANVWMNGNIAESIVSRHRNGRTETCCPPWLRCNHLPKERGRARISLSQTPSQLCSAKKWSPEKTRWKHAKRLRP